jgi:hypothetical protein
MDRIFDLHTTCGNQQQRFYPAAERKELEKYAARGLHGRRIHTTSLALG